MNTRLQEQQRQWGRVVWEKPDALPAGSYQTITLRYRAGSLGIDEHGGIRVSFRFVSDFGTLQLSDPGADNYVTASTRQGLRLELSYVSKGNVRPYQKTLFVHVMDGALWEGDEIKIVIGDRAGGSRGWRLQSFVEEFFPLRVEADPFGAHDYVLLPEQPGFEICAGAPHRYHLHVPSLLRAGEPFALRVKCEDVWGNPLRHLAERPTLAMLREDTAGQSVPVRVNPRHDRGVLRYDMEGVDAPGVYRFVVEEGVVPGVTSNPVRVVDAQAALPYRYHWCDLHGQTGETVGTGTVEGYFDFGRHYGFLDGSCHQGNDFQIDEGTWRRIVAAGNNAYEAGAFVTFNGIEWSGNTPMGGDHNVLFNETDPPLYRSTGWLASDGTKMEEVAPLAKLYATLRKHQAMTIPHIGGRPAALEETDPELERLVEIHSAWGTFEWVYRRAFAKGYKVGFVCNSDGHKARPGASYPGASKFGTLGGLTCVLATEKTRDAFWEALTSRRCYGTTGQRIYLEVEAEGRPMGADVQVGGAFTIAGTVHGTAPLLAIDLLREHTVIDSLPIDALQPPPGAQHWVLIRLGGSRVYGRGRQVDWQGRVTLEGNRLLDARMHGLFNPLQGIQQWDADGVAFNFISTGNSLNLCLQVEAPGKGTLAFRSGPAEFSIDLAELSPSPRRMMEKPIDQFLELSLCPIEALPLSLPFRFGAPPPDQPETPYFVRVVQLDEGKAWSSPFYVSRA
ncbi:MAG: DUF3604 domain-containing protein [SAR324 cluster bacterium]|nr:DUF3604 domain-containing protein [SAR324 cluster bacterium]